MLSTIVLVLIQNNKFSPQFTNEINLSLEKSLEIFMDGVMYFI